MLQTNLFTKTQKFAPKGEPSKNAQLLIRAGFVHKEMAGVYAYLPLGLRVLENIKKIVRDEMDKISGQELIMTTLQQKNLWERTNRWDDKNVDVWFKSKLKTGSDVGLAWSHEEPVGNMMLSYISSYKDLPIYTYQFQTKMRNELRAKSGIMRGREFIMKDAYSFCADEKQHNHIYDMTKIAYMKIFERVGLAEDTFITFASGGAFTQFSHEFQTICDAGEDTIYINKERDIAINEEVLSEETLKELNTSRDELKKVKSAETGNIFNFGRQKAKDLGLTFTTTDGEDIPVWMGSYGIGITRLMGVIVEKFSDKNGLSWPAAVAPFQIHLIDIGQKEKAKKLYDTLTKLGVEILWDNRDERPGKKFADADLIGIPTRIVISERSLESGGVEIKKRTEKEGEIINTEELIKKYAN